MNHLTSLKPHLFGLLLAVGTGTVGTAAHATSSGELYTSDSYSYGRFEARVQFAGGDGVVSSFFLWKDASEMEDVYWNELDLETIWADCELKTNALYGLPEANHTDSSGTEGGWCTGFHTYAFEWTPDYVAWFVDGTELRRETGEDSTAFRDNAADGMQIHFNTWPGDSTFGGNFTEAILPIHEYINWVQYSSYADGVFTLEWREDFAGSTLPEGWLTGSWDSPKGLSTHMPENVSFSDGYAVISLTTDDALGPVGAMPMDPEGGGPVDPVDPSMGSGGSGAGGSSDGTGGAVGAGGAAPGNGGAPASGSGGMPAGGTGASSDAGGSSPDPSSTGGSSPDPSSPSSGGQMPGVGGTPGTAGGPETNGGCAVGGSNQTGTPWGGLAMALALYAVRRLRHGRGHGARAHAT